MLLCAGVAPLEYAKKPGKISCWGEVLKIDDAAQDRDLPIDEMIGRRVLARAGEWVSGIGSSPTVLVTRISRRPSCSLFAVRIADLASTPLFLAKCRRDVKAPRRSTHAVQQARPRLRNQPLDAESLSVAEYEGLRSIAAGIGSGDPDLGVIRPLDLVPGRATIIMDYVDAPTLRHRLLTESRLSLGGRAARRDAGSARVWRAVGSWLHRFQQSIPAESKPASQSMQHEIVDLFHAHHDFLASRVGARAVGDVALIGAELARDLLPAWLPLAVGHGDYAPRNMFVGTDGRLSVFDPMPRWSVPRYEDLCRCLVGMRLVGAQVRTLGAAFSRAEMERHEAEAIAGFAPAAETPLAQLRCYQLLILLDKWSALVESTGRGPGFRARAQRASFQLAQGYLRGQARQLIDLTRSAAQ